MTHTMNRATQLSDQINAMGFCARVEGGSVYISAEEGDDAADYYGEFRGGGSWINPKIEAVCEKAGYELEWNNPGQLVAFAA